MAVGIYCINLLKREAVTSGGIQTESKGYPNGIKAKSEKQCTLIHVLVSSNDRNQNAMQDKIHNTLQLFHLSVKERRYLLSLSPEQCFLALFCWEEEDRSPELCRV